MKLLKSIHLDNIMRATGLSSEEILDRLSAPQGWPVRGTDHIEQYRPWKDAKHMLEIGDKHQDDYNWLQFTTHDDGCDHCGSLHLDHTRISPTQVEAFCTNCKNTSIVESEVLPEHGGGYVH